MNCLTKNGFIVLALLVSFCATASVFAVQEADVKVVGYSAAVKNPDSEYNGAYANGLQIGTQIHLRVVLKDQHITEIKGEYKEFEMTDSTGKKMKMGYGDMGFMSSIADDAASVVCPVSSDDVASEKAESISLKGKLICVLGTNEQEEEVEVKIAKDAEIKLAGLDITVDEVRDHYEDGQQVMTFKTNKEMNAIKSIEAILENGETAVLKTVGNSSWGSGDNVTVQKEMVVEGKASDIKKLKVTFFKDLKELEIPVDMKIGFGFAK